MITPSPHIPPDTFSKNGKKDVPQIVEHLFRHQAGQMVATLTRYFGIANLDLVEDVVQETLLKALQQWTYRGIPDNPAGWILQSAKNQAIDILRRQTTFRDKQDEIIKNFTPESGNSQNKIYLENELKDDQLRMMFTCCHPLLPPESRVALTLKTLCGFSVAEIARAFLASETTMAQRLVRAKRKIRNENIPFEVPDQKHARERLDSVLEVLYLLFNEGYSAHQGEDLVRQDLCEEAIRLTCILIEHPVGNQPKVHALLALMLLQSSRIPARLDADGRLLLLKEQDRRLWNQRLIQLGLQHLERAAQGEDLTQYHLQAGIAACHAIAPDYDSTDWKAILQYYNELVAQTDSPVIALNRAVALSMVDGAEAALADLQRLRQLPLMKSYYLLPATFAEFYHRIGDVKNAIDFYQQALHSVGTQPERRFLQGKLAECKQEPHTSA